MCELISGLCLHVFFKSVYDGGAMLCRCTQTRFMYDQEQKITRCHGRILRGPADKSLF